MKPKNRLIAFFSDKNVLTHIVAGAFVLVGYALPAYNEQVTSIGYFALSGSVTNWLAIYMLFERVPFLYGSGVIPDRFEDFKEGIKRIVMQQFFTHENIERLIKKEGHSKALLLNIDPLLDSIDYDKIFQGLIDTVMDSSYRRLMGLFGGIRALESLRLPLKHRLQRSFRDMVAKDSFKNALAASVDMDQLSAEILKNIEIIVDQRLDELTPQLVKQIMEDMIKEHLGWLVVWGGVFGGLIGLIAAFLP